MQIQGTGEIGSTKRKFHLSGVPLIESRLYFISFVSNGAPLTTVTIYAPYKEPHQVSFLTLYLINLNISSMVNLTTTMKNSLKFDFQSPDLIQT